MTEPVARPWDPVLGFWFNALSPDDWFQGGPAVDQKIHDAWSGLYPQAADGRLDGWADDDRGGLALILLLDQGPRNLFRKSAQAFATDAQAKDVAERLLARGAAASLRPLERRFLYLPLEHSEDLSDQKRCVALMQADGDDPDALPFAEQHLAVIERFGRFPHRNAVLGRESTPEEIAYLAENPGGF